MLGMLAFPLISFLTFQGHPANAYFSPKPFGASGRGWPLPLRAKSIEGKSQFHPVASDAILAAFSAFVADRLCWSGGGQPRGTADASRLIRLRVMGKYAFPG
jgi:hypothetical protein